MTSESTPLHHYILGFLDAVLWVSYTKIYNPLKYVYRSFTHPKFSLASDCWPFVAGVTFFKMNQMLDICDEYRIDEIKIGRGILDLTAIGYFSNKELMGSSHPCSCCPNIGFLENKSSKKI